MHSSSLPTFMSAPLSVVRATCPSTIVYAPGGTRRAARLAGFDPYSDAYAVYTFSRMLKATELFVRCGVRHLVQVVVSPNQLAEHGAFSDRIAAWTTRWLNGADALAAFAARRWRVRILGAETWPAIEPTAGRLVEAASPDAPAATIWFSVCGTPGGHWAALLRAGAAGARSQAAASTWLWREPIPPARIYLAFGKPEIHHDVVHPLLAGPQLRCYWSQRPGYAVDELSLRQIIYDATVAAPPGAQAGAAQISGIGRRVGSFWYPAETPVEH